MFLIKKRHTESYEGNPVKRRAKDNEERRIKHNALITIALFDTKIVRIPILFEK